MWFKVDDGFWSHPKTLQLSDGAQALWMRAGTWSMQQMTDGLIPDYALPILSAKPRYVNELRSVSLWFSVKDGNQFHDWDKYQPTREQVEADRRASADRKRKSRENSHRPSRVTDAVRDGVTDTPPDPTRPDPTRPEEAKASPSSKTGTKISTDWAPSADHLALAKTLRLDVIREADMFRLHAETHDRRAVRWNAAFTMWLKKATPAPKAKLSGYALELASYQPGFYDVKS